MPALNNARQRILSVDILRGIVMIIMALDHTRDYFTNVTFNPLDVTQTTVPLFFTRWITHFCAPVFVFLSGTSVFLTMRQGKSRREASMQLLLRGLWLLILELTIVRFGWTFNVDYHTLFVQVIWAIGWSMIALAVLLHTPRWFMLSLCLTLIIGQHLFDPFDAQWAVQAPFWHVLHEPGDIILGDGIELFVLYPLIPWIAVMPMGYLFGNLLALPAEKRDRVLRQLGLALIALFVLLRIWNVYGDPQARTGHWLSFFNTTKYPPSFQYLLMTLGPAIAVMPLLEKMANPIGRFLSVYGRTPLFYYMLHIYLIHGLECIGRMLLGAPAKAEGGVFGADASWGFDLPIVYAVWVLVVLLLYLPCLWMMQVKQRHKAWWTSYI